MSGKGRGQGSGLSLTQEQLHALGIARGETTAPTLAAPPLFPKLENKPLPLPCDAATDYMLIVKQQFVEHLLETPVYVTAKTENRDVERYSDKYRILSQNSKKQSRVECVWAHVPDELRPSQKRIGTSNPRKRKLEKKADITERLQTLEKKELKEEQESGEQGQATGDGEEAEDEELEEEQEYEADDGTDYGNNYFDNGEETEDEEDKLDEGPVF